MGKIEGESGSDVMSPVFIRSVGYRKCWGLCQAKTQRDVEGGGLGLWSKALGMDTQSEIGQGQVVSFVCSVDKGGYSGIWPPSSFSEAKLGARYVRLLATARPPKFQDGGGISSISCILVRPRGWVAVTNARRVLLAQRPPMVDHCVRFNELVCRRAVYIYIR